MKRQIIILGAAALALGAAGSASAAEISLGMDTDEYPTHRGLGIDLDGTVNVGVKRGVFLQRFVARLVADDGLPVTTCLGAKRHVSLVVKATGQVRAVSTSCPGKDGLFEMRPVGSYSIQTPTLLVAKLPASVTAPESGAPQTISRVVSNGVRVLIAPHVINESPLYFAGTGGYPIHVRVAAPPAGRKGTIYVMRLVGKEWKVLSRHTPDADGRIRTHVTTPYSVNKFAFVFAPKAGTGYIPSATLFIIRMTKDPAPAGTSTPDPMASLRTLSFTRVGVSQSRQLAVRARKG